MKSSEVQHAAPVGHAAEHLAGQIERTGHQHPALRIGQRIVDRQQRVLRRAAGDGTALRGQLAQLFAGVTWPVRLMQRHEDEFRRDGAISFRLPATSLSRNPAKTIRNFSPGAASCNASHSAASPSGLCPPSTNSRSLSCWHRAGQRTFASPSSARSRSSPYLDCMNFNTG